MIALKENIFKQLELKSDRQEIYQSQKTGFKRDKKELLAFLKK